MSSTNVIYKMKMKESKTSFVRQMSCEKKKMFSLPDKQISILIWILVHQVVFAYSQPSK